jgi:uncharacterized membrane protein
MGVVDPRKYFRKETKMKTAITILLMLSLTMLYGCESSSSPQGGSVIRDEGFKVVVPAGTTEIKQGEIQTAVVSLARDNYFKQDVELLISSTQGISVEPTHVLIKSSDKPEVQVRVTVASDAALGEYSVRVEGTPKTGEPTSTVFTIKVVSP